VLFFGVLGALVLRGGFIAAGAALIATAEWVLYVFAVFLLYTGYRMLRQRDEHVDPESSRALRLFRRYVPMTDFYVGQRFLVRRAGVVIATPLLAVLVLVEVTDVIFAVDSIPAIFAVTDEPFLVFTANAFALLGLRAMYFLLADLIHRFVYLKAGLAVVLMWVGVKMFLKVDVLYVPTTLSLAVITTILAVSIGASLLRTRGESGHGVPVPPSAPFRQAEAADLDGIQPVLSRCSSLSGALRLDPPQRSQPQPATRRDVNQIRAGPNRRPHRDVIYIARTCPRRIRPRPRRAHVRPRLGRPSWSAEPLPSYSPPP
jgi:tellurite resistance protein TerC